MSENNKFTQNNESPSKKHVDLDYSNSVSNSNEKSDDFSYGKIELKTSDPIYAKPLNLETGMKYKSVKDYDKREIAKYEIGEFYKRNFQRVRGVFNKKSQHMHGQIVFFKVNFFSRIIVYF